MSIIGADVGSDSNSCNEVVEADKCEPVNSIWFMKSFPGRARSSCRVKKSDEYDVNTDSDGRTLPGRLIRFGLDELDRNRALPDGSGRNDEPLRPGSRKIREHVP